MNRAASSILFTVYLFFPVVFISGCAVSPLPISISISPSATQMDEGRSVSIGATVTNDRNAQGVTWSLSGPGSLSLASTNGVLYNAPATSASSFPQIATISVTSVADPSKSASVQITVNSDPILPFQTLSSGAVGTPYSQVIALTGGTPPFQWSIYNGPAPAGGIEGGAVPGGLQLNSSNGTISGTPTGAGTWYFDATVTDADGLSAGNGFLSIQVNPTAQPGNPIPYLSQPLVPSSASPGNGALTLHVSGIGFVSGATVDFNGTPLTSAFVDGEHLSACVPGADVAQAGTASVRVVNPTPGGGSSNVIYFPVAAPETTVNFSAASGPPITVGGVGALASTLAVGDFTGNGRPDLVTAYGGGQVIVLLANGDGTFTQAPGSPFLMEKPPFNNFATIWPHSLTLGDFNNSGKLGFAIADWQNANVDVFFGNGDGSFTPSSALLYTKGGSPSPVVAGDFARSGNLDLSLVTFSGVGFATFLGYGDGAFNYVTGQAPLYVNSETAGNANLVAVGDFNGDDKLDLAYVGLTQYTPATQTSVGGIFTLLGDGDGTFAQAPGSPLTFGANPSAIAAADFNGDGKLDLAVVDYQNNTVSILLGNGDGTFTQAPGSPIPVGTAPDAIAVGDFTGNGKLDLAVANSGSNNVTILFDNGDGTFTEASGSPFAVGNGPGALALGDFNGDGRLDLAVLNSTDGTLSILLQH